MPAVEASVEVFGEKVLRRRLTRFAARLTDSTSAFRAVAGILARSTYENFVTRGAYGGHTWRDLAPATKTKRLRANPADNLAILRVTNRLLGSLILRAHPEHVEHLGAHELRWGSRVPYGVYHQSTKPRTLIPWRPPVRLPEQDRREIVKSLQRSLVEGV